MWTVQEVSKRTGVSIRTLHHYNAIDLLQPAALTEAGYRLYDEKCLERLQTILFFRELQFPLKDIKNILDSPDFDQKKALEQQITLLKLQKQHLENLIALAQNLKEKGVNTMEFKAFDKKQIEEYEKQAKASWGNTNVYREYEEKSRKHTAEEKQQFGQGMMQIFEEFGRVKEENPKDSVAQELVKKLQNYITEHYYTCTKDILFSLGQMYVMDERFKKNIDKKGGEGTAAFVAEVIKHYCGK